MTRRAQLTVFFCLSGLCLCSFSAIAQSGAGTSPQSERTIHGQLQGTDLKPSPGLKIKSQKLGTSAVTKISGEFIIKVGSPADSLIVQLPGSGQAKVAVSATDQMMMITIQKDGTLKVLGEGPPSKDSTHAAVVPLVAADTSRPVHPVDSGAVAQAPAGAATGAPVTTTTGTATAAPAGATHSELEGIMGGMGGSDTTRPAKAKDTTGKGPAAPVIKGPIVKGTVEGPGNIPLDSVRITTAEGKSFLGQNNGTFIAPFVKGSYLLISRPGYETVKLVLTTPGETLHVKLTRSKTREIQEVTVTALGITQKTRALAYAVTEAKGEEVQVAKTTNFTDALQGKLAGVDININSGSMGGSTEVTMRGNKSVTESNDALYVVDGVFMSNLNVNSSSTQIGGGGYDYGSPIQDINPDDIQEVSVLKGAASTALYGSRGQNGVILVTTKKGSAHKLGIEYGMNVEMQKVYVLPKYQNQYGGGNSSTFDTLWYNGNQQYFKSASSPAYTDPTRGGYDLLPDYAVDESWGPPLDGQLVRPYYSFDADKDNPFFDQLATWSPQPNNVKDFFVTGLTVNNNLAISGGDDKATYRLSYGNMTQKFILPNSHQTRNNLSFNSTYRINDWLTAVASANFAANDATGRPGTGFTGENPMLNLVMYGQRQLNINYMKIYKYADGTQLDWNRTSYSNPAPAGDDNIYWNRWMEPETDTRNRVFGQAGFDVHPVSWLNITSRVFMDEFSTLEEERTAKDYYTGSYVRNNYDFQELDYQVLATAKTGLGKNFDLNASLGGNVEQQNEQYNSGSTNGGLIIPGIYTLANSASPPTLTSDIIRKQINSVFGMASFGYKDLLFLDLTGRNDWSSALPPGNNSYFYPSAAMSFVFSDLLKYSWLSFAKLRTSWAQIGNDLPPYNIYQTYAAPGLFGTNPTIAVTSSLANPNLRPERSTEYEEGLEARFLKSRVGFDFSWYDRMTRDLIIPIQTSAASGYSSFYANAGTVRNRGVEIELNGRPLDFKNFSWDISINFAQNRNRVMAINVPNNPTQNEVVIGTERRLNSVSVAAIVGKPLFALTGTDYTYNNGKRVVDSASGLYVPSAPGQVIGSTVPDFTGGVTNTFRYKNLILSVLINYQKGGDFFSYTNLYGEYSGTLAVTAANNIRQTGIAAPGVYADGKPNTTVLTAEDYFQSDQGKQVNKANMYDDSYIYLREVRLGYSLPHRWAGKIRADEIRLSLYGRNLWLIKSNAPNVDPSSIINSDSNIQGLEGGALPSVRSYGVNLNVGF